MIMYSWHVFVCVLRICEWSQLQMSIVKFTDKESAGSESTDLDVSNRLGDS